MEPITHNHLVHILKASINGHGAKASTLCVKAGVSEDDLFLVLEGRKLASAGMLAKLGWAMGLDFYSTWIRYAMWRFETETHSAQVKAKPRPEAATVLNAHEIAKQIILASPYTPEDTLAHHLKDKLLLDLPYLRAQISLLRANQQTGDYHHNG